MHLDVLGLYRSWLREGPKDIFLREFSGLWVASVL